MSDDVRALVKAISEARKAEDKTAALRAAVVEAAMAEDVARERYFTHKPSDLDALLLFERMRAAKEARIAAVRALRAHTEGR